MNHQARKDTRLQSHTLITIPVYNGEEFIARTLDSCISQTLPSEIWVVDNLSTDNTRTIVKKYQKKYPQIRFIENPENLGRVGNWNRCLDLFMDSPYQYVHFVFAGDELLPTCNHDTEAILKKHTNIGALAFPYEFIHKDGSVTLSRHKKIGHRLFTSKEIIKKTLGHGGFLGAILCNVYAKRAIQATRFSYHFTGKHDFDLKILSRSQAYYLDKILARFHLNAHRTFDKAYSSWGFMEFTYIEAKMLEEFKDMFAPHEYTGLKKRIIQNGLQNQLQFFDLNFSLKIIWMVCMYWLEKNINTVTYFFSHYWKQWTKAQ